MMNKRDALSALHLEHLTARWGGLASPAVTAAILHHIHPRASRWTALHVWGTLVAWVDHWTGEVRRPGPYGWDPRPLTKRERRASGATKRMATALRDLRQAPRLTDRQRARLRQMESQRLRRLEWLEWLLAQQREARATARERGPGMIPWMEALRIPLLGLHP
jgi:hypothetical protein